MPRITFDTRADDGRNESENVAAANTATSQADCPPYLQNLSAKDERTLKTSDADVQLLAWTDILEMQARKCFENFQRRPSDLRRYLKYSHDIRHRYGSVTAYLLKERLKWHGNTKPKPGGRLFEHSEDWKILWNDWPYAIQSNIAHLVVWTKSSLNAHPCTGALDVHTTEQVNRFVSVTFASNVREENIIWFRNSKAYSSVQDIEHIHVILLHPNPEFLRLITAGDIPLYQREPTDHFIKPILH